MRSAFVAPHPQQPRPPAARAWARLTASALPALRPASPRAACHVVRLRYCFLAAAASPSQPGSWALHWGRCALSVHGPTSHSQAGRHTLVQAGAFCGTLSTSGRACLGLEPHADTCAPSLCLPQDSRTLWARPPATAAAGARSVAVLGHNNCEPNTTARTGVTDQCISSHQRIREPWSRSNDGDVWRPCVSHGD